MEARTLLTTLILLVVSMASATAQQLYQVNTPNFSINAPSVQMAKKAAQLAEKYRAELSQEWLGYEIPQWQERCPIVIEINRHAGGETSFGFAGGSRDGSVKAVPMGWQMKIFGPPDRVLDAVLPHEITHTIFATHFGRPLPRWADEGACTTVEHESERAKNHQLLLDFLTASPSRGIPFNRMFIMKQYPDDILPLYAQGYSLARFLIQQKGKRQFIKYIESGLAMERPVATLKGWDLVTDEYYGYDDLSELQVAWVGWVKNGCPDLSINRSGVAAVSFESEAPASNRVAFAEGNKDSFYAQQMLQAEKAELNEDSNSSNFNKSPEWRSANRDYSPGSIATPKFSEPNVPPRRSSTMSSKANTVWR